MKLNAGKTRIISFPRKTNMLTFNYVRYNCGIPLTDCIRDVGVSLDSKIYFHQHVDDLFAHAIKLSGLIWTITFPFLLQTALRCFAAAYLDQILNILLFGILLPSLTSIKLNATRKSLLPYVT
jgi:hypothetical protein